MTEPARTWMLSKAMSELVAAHGVTLASPPAVALSEATAPMLLSGYASTCNDIDCERVCFAPFAFDPIPDHVELRFDHGDQIVGRIETLAHNDRGDLEISAYVDGLDAVKCNAFSISGDVLDFTLHNTDSASFYARVTKCRLREVSLVPNPVNSRARVLRREQPSVMSKYVASRMEQYDLLIKALRLITRQAETIGRRTA